MVLLVFVQVEERRVRHRRQFLRLGARLLRRRFHFRFVFFRHRLGGRVRLEISENTVERVGIVRRRAGRRGRRRSRGGRRAIRLQRARLDRFRGRPVEIIERVQFARVRLNQMLQHLFVSLKSLTKDRKKNTQRIFNGE